MKNRVAKKLGVVLFLTLLLLMLGSDQSLADSSEIVSFKKWKDVQVVNAQNERARLANQVQWLNREIESKGEDGQIHGPFMGLKGQRDDLLTNEFQLSQAKERLVITQELTIDDYIEVYLKQFLDKPEIIQKWAQTIPQEEMAEYMVRLLKGSEQPIGKPLVAGDLPAGLGKAKKGAQDKL